MKISVNNEYIDVAGRKVLIVSQEKNTAGRKLFLGYQIDRDKRRVGGERWFKSDGRDFHGTMESNLCRDADCGMTLNDRQAVILERIIEAIDTDMALPMATGPKRFGSAWPETSPSSTEIRGHETVELVSGTEHLTRQRHSAVNDVTERRAKCSKARVTRMEETFEWMPAFVWDHEIRVVLFAYAMVKARGWDWSRHIEARNRRHPHEKAWVKRTLYRWIERALQQIESGMLNRSILLMDTAGLQVAHEEAKQAGKSITSGLHAWPAPDEHPALKRSA